MKLQFQLLYSFTENKIEKMDIDESIVEDNDKDKLAKNPLEETPNDATHVIVFLFSQIF